MSVELCRRNPGTDDAAEAGKYAGQTVQIVHAARIVNTETRRQERLQQSRHADLRNTTALSVLCPPFSMFLTRITHATECYRFKQCKLFQKCLGQDQENNDGLL